MSRLFSLIIFLLVGITNNYAQGISIGAAGDILVNAVDGEHFPVRRNIEFNLGEVMGNFTLEVDGYFNDSEDIPYISRFQGLINMYRSSSPTTYDYRHINVNEVLTVTLSDINITEGYEIFIEGMNGKMLEDDVILCKSSSSIKDTITGTSDNDYYALLPEMMPVAENNTVEISTLEGAWRRNYLNFVFFSPD
jgi:hypothetical protein